MSAPRFLKVAPVLVVRDVPASAEFWREKLGFTRIDLYGEPPRFAMVGRDEVVVMLAQVEDGKEPPLPNWRTVDKTNQIYIWVDDVTALYSEVQQHGAPIDFTLYDTPWGTREFGTQDLDDHDIAFGQVLDRAKD